ncbi:MAG: gamma-glutamyl-gamma-aminobutyrate hydrolase family protein [Ruminococcaceae bacterium]|nr:gamma-glutamyl-gamma-aminobutyrate hydrolase family protein [Oscillospiraceae bacterium]
MQDKIIIGILGIVDDEVITKLQNTYTKAIESSGGIPLLLPYVEKDESIDTFVKICDGFLFTGGADIEPSRYGEEKKDTCGNIHPYRDELEFKAFEKIYPTGKPIMAICRGAQFVNVALGGSLYQDIPTESPSDIQHVQSEPKNSPSHSVKIISGTPLSEFISSEEMSANSFHHQAIKTLGKGLCVMAIANDGIIEALYSTENRYLHAYQWHPERLFESEKSNALLFRDFIAACDSKKHNA